jgi:protocatechuate 3,4-dioxygenase beta subunit
MSILLNQITRRKFNRRTALIVLRSTATALLVGCLPRRVSSAQSSTPACTVRPQQTEGPYFVDEKLDRSDIRSNTANGEVKPGIPFQLKLQVVQVSDRSCTPLSGAIVDIWHCDASGAYSDVSDRRVDTSGQNFLRGYQTTDASGNVEFLTIYPGWYQGRTVHIHFKVRTTAGTEFTSQLYFDDALTDQVHAQQPYRNGRTVRNDRDGIFQDGGTQLLLAPEKTGQGYAATFSIGLQTA